MTTAFASRKLPFSRSWGRFCEAKLPPFRWQKPQNAFKRFIFQTSTFSFSSNMDDPCKTVYNKSPQKATVFLKQIKHRIKKELIFFKTFLYFRVSVEKIVVLSFLVLQNRRIKDIMSSRFLFRKDISNEKTLLCRFQRAP